MRGKYVCFKYVASSASVLEAGRSRVNKALGPMMHQAGDIRDVQGGERKQGSLVIAVLKGVQY